MEEGGWYGVLLVMNQALVRIKSDVVPRISQTILVDEPKVLEKQGKADKYLMGKLVQVILVEPRSDGTYYCMVCYPPDVWFVEALVKAALSSTKA